MTDEQEKLICKKFFEKHTHQFELAAGDDKFLYFYHTIMDFSVKVSLEGDELKVENLGWDRMN